MFRMTTAFTLTISPRLVYHTARLRVERSNLFVRTPKGPGVTVKVEYVAAVMLCSTNTISQKPITHQHTHTHVQRR